MTRQNPILPIKQGSKFYKCNFSTLRALIVGQNPSSQRKNLRIAGETQLVPTGEIDQKVDPSVTTNHLLLLSLRGRASWSLPISLRNPDSVDDKSTRKLTSRGGGQSDATDKTVLPVSSHGIFGQWGPCPFSLARKKKGPSQAQRNSIACASFT
jgi:hypothetical protein